VSCLAGFTAPAHLRIEGPLFTEDTIISADRGTFRRAVTVPPGHFPVHFRCDARRVQGPTEARNLVFRVQGFLIRRVAD
jgi:hypothetical protein